MNQTDTDIEDDKNTYEAVVTMRATVEVEALDRGDARAIASTLASDLNPQDDFGPRNVVEVHEVTDE